MDDMQHARLTSCAKVFVSRDYSDGIAVKFETRMPQEMQGKGINAQDFEHVINHINSIYADAENLSARTCFENCFACLTAYTLLLCMPTYYEKCVKKASAYIAQENERLFIPKGFLMVDPMERGLRCIEICLINEPATSNTATTTTTTTNTYRNNNRNVV